MKPYSILLILIALVSGLASAAEVVERGNTEIRYRNSTLKFDPNSSIRDVDGAWQIDWSKLQYLSTNTGSGGGASGIATDTGSGTNTFLWNPSFGMTYANQSLIQLHGGNPVGFNTEAWVGPGYSGGHVFLGVYDTNGVPFSYPVAPPFDAGWVLTFTNAVKNFGLINVPVSRYLPADPTTTDCASAFNSCMADAPDGAIIELPATTMVFDNPVQIPNKRFWIRGAGQAKTVLYNRQAYGVPVFYANATTGGATNITQLATAATLSADSEVGAQTVAVSDASGITAGNVYCLWDNDQESGSGYYRAEMVKVHSITNTTTIVLESPITRNHYTSASAKLAAVRQNNYVMSDFTVDGVDNSGSGVSFIYGGYTYGSVLRRIKLAKIGYSSSSHRYEGDFLMSECEFIGQASQDPNQGYASFLVNCSRVVVERCVMRSLQWMTFEHSVNCLSLFNRGYSAGTVGWHGYNRKCTSIGDRIEGGTQARGSNANGTFVSDRSVDSVFINCSVVNNAAQGFSIGVAGAETNITLLNCVIEGSEQSAAAGEPQTVASSCGIQLTSVNGATIDGLIGVGITAGITLSGCSGDIVIRRVRIQGSTSSSAAVRLATTTSSSANLYMSDIWSSRLIYDEASSMAVNSFSLDGAFSPYDPKWALWKTARGTEGAAIKRISGIFGSYNAVSSARYDTDGGITIWTPSTLNTAFISDSGYSTVLAPGRGSGPVLLYKGYASTTSANVNVVLPHDVPYVTAGKEFTIINGDATTTGSTTPNLPVKENGTTLFSFPTNTQGSWIKVKYCGVTNYWDAGSLNWKVVDSSPTLGVRRKTGTLTIAADGTVTNVFTVPFQSGVTPSITLTPTVSTGGTNWFVTSADNTMFKATGPISGTFYWSASSGDQ